MRTLTFLLCGCMVMIAFTSIELITDKQPKIAACAGCNQAVASASWAAWNELDCDGSPEGQGMECNNSIEWVNNAPRVDSVVPQKDGSIIVSLTVSEGEQGTIGVVVHATRSGQFEHLGA